MKRTAEPQKARPEASDSERRGTPKLPENLTESESSLINIICKGFKDSSPDATKKLLEEGKEPVEIIDRCIVPALDIVGKDFEIGKKFLPQLLLSADTVSNSFAVIKAHLEASGVAQESKGSIVICTVFGDIHDIGKNIVKAMLENYGYTVIDLGKNVPAEKIVQTVLEKDIQLVGLSALMTTTVANMEDTIKLLREKLGQVGKTCKIMVGGAVLTEDYASQIGADYYAKDAMVSVSIAKEVFGK
jgi:5-methyltetrahydrofolate--homocysteine methyltransferase